MFRLQILKLQQNFNQVVNNKLMVIINKCDIIISVINYSDNE